MGDFSFLINSVQNITGPMVVMWLIGGLLIWLAIKKDYEPALLLPMGFGAILVNLPDTGVLGDNGVPAAAVCGNRRYDRFWPLAFQS